jgi:hypothetical protein
MVDMEVIVRHQDQERCASITCMIRHYVARRAQVTEGHPHNADERALSSEFMPAIPQCGDGSTSIESMILDWDPQTSQFSDGNDQI